MALVLRKNCRAFVGTNSGLKSEMGRESISWRLMGCYGIDLINGIAALRQDGRLVGSNIRQLLSIDQLISPM